MPTAPLCERVSLKGMGGAGRAAGAAEELPASIDVRRLSLGGQPGRHGVPELTVEIIAVSVGRHG